MERTELESLKIHDIRSLAEHERIEFTPNDNKEMLINKLLIASSAVVIEPEVAPVYKKPPICSIEQVKDALNPFILRGLKLYHNPDDQTWFMQVKIKPVWVRDTNTGEKRLVERTRDDSGTLHQPLETIRRCARVLMSNAPTLRETEPERNPANGYSEVA